MRLFWTILVWFLIEVPGIVAWTFVTDGAPVNSFWVTVNICYGMLLGLVAFFVAFCVYIGLDNTEVIK